MVNVLPHLDDALTFIAQRMPYGESENTYPNLGFNRLLRRYQKIMQYLIAASVNIVQGDL